MSKQANSSQNGPQAKGTRLPTGIQLVRPVPSSSQSASSLNSSLFVTLSANPHQHGRLTGESRLITSAPKFSEPPLGTVSDPQDKGKVPQNDQVDSGDQGFAAWP